LKSGSARGAEQVSGVSLADAGLLVVVFLLVCSTFAIENGLFLRLPVGEAGRGRASGECVRVVTLGSGGVEINGRPQEPGGVGSAVRAALARNSGVVVVVEAGPGAKAAVIANILGEVRQAGATRISLSKRRR
jgi:biopolymer transport protein ExbD